MFMLWLHDICVTTFVDISFWLRIWGILHCDNTQEPRFISSIPALYAWSTICLMHFMTEIRHKVFQVNSAFSALYAWLSETATSGI